MAPAPFENRRINIVAVIHTGQEDIVGGDFAPQATSSLEETDGRDATIGHLTSCGGKHGGFSPRTTDCPDRRPSPVAAQPPDHRRACCSLLCRAAQTPSPATSRQNSRRASINAARDDDRRAGERLAGHPARPRMPGTRRSSSIRAACTNTVPASRPASTVTTKCSAIGPLTTTTPLARWITPAASRSAAQTETE